MGIERVRDIVLLDFFETNDGEKMLENLSGYLGIECQKVLGVTKTIPDQTSICIILSQLIRDLDIDLSHRYYMDTFIRCRHMTTTDDNLSSIERFGLLDLEKTLTHETNLKRFLASREIYIDIKNKQMIYKGINYPIYYTSYEIRDIPLTVQREYQRCGTSSILENNIGINQDIYHENMTRLYARLYMHDMELEAFISGELRDIKIYSCIASAPEILRDIYLLLQSIEGHRDFNLCDNWCEKESMYTYILEFDLPIEYLTEKYLEIDMDLVELDLRENIREMTSENNEISSTVNINYFILRSLVLTYFEDSPPEHCHIKKASIIDYKDIRVIDSSLTCSRSFT